jgi:hypothetical protein
MFGKTGIMMRVLPAAMVMVALMTPGSATAESTAEAIRAFGLVGTWSWDCARSDRDRMTFATPLFGASTITSGKKGHQDEVIEISEAVRVTDDKIKLTFLVKKIVGNPDPDPWLDANPGESWELVFAKYGNKIKWILQAQKDGPKIRVLDGFYAVPDVPDGQGTREARKPLAWKKGKDSTELYEKCLN